CPPAQLGKDSIPADHAPKKSPRRDTDCNSRASPRPSRHVPNESIRGLYRNAIREARVALTLRCNTSAGTEVPSVHLRSRCSEQDRRETILRRPSLPAQKKCRTNPTRDRERESHSNPEAN